MNHIIIDVLNITKRKIQNKNVYGLTEARRFILKHFTMNFEKFVKKKKKKKRKLYQKLA
jgi:hypothetical protein